MTEQVPKPDGLSEENRAFAELRAIYQQWADDELDGPMLVMEALGRYLAARTSPRSPPTSGEAVALVQRVTADIECLEENAGYAACFGTPRSKGRDRWNRDFARDLRALIALAHPAPTPSEEELEAWARIIDPIAFEHWDRWKALLPDGNWQVPRSAIEAERENVERALAKARKIAARRTQGDRT